MSEVEVDVFFFEVFLLFGLGFRWVFQFAVFVEQSVGRSEDGEFCPSVDLVGYLLLVGIQIADVFLREDVAFFEPRVS